MTTFFFRRSVEKAFQLDEQPTDLSLDLGKTLSSNPPYISSAVDDVMYMMNQVVDRSLSTSQRPVISSIIPTVSRVLSSDFIGMVQRKMRDESYPKAAVQGALPPEQVTISFFVLLNNLDVAIDYVKRIVQPRIEPRPNASSQQNGGVTAGAPLKSQFPLDHDSTTVVAALSSLQSSFEAKANELIGDAVMVVYKNIVKPRLRPLLADAFRDVDYQMNEDDLDDLRRSMAADTGIPNAIDTLVQDRFQEGWLSLTKPISRLLTERNFEKLLFHITTYLGEVLEKRVWSYYGRLNELGAARLERDVGSIINVVVRGQKYGLRAPFVRCTQICLVMNMEDEEWEDLRLGQGQMDSSDEDWQIDAEERARSRGMLVRKGRPGFAVI